MNRETTQHHKADQQNGGLNLRDVLTVFFKYKHMIITVLFLFMLVSLVFAYSIKPVYVAETSLLVKMGREHLFTSETNDSSPRMAIDIQTIVDPELEILASQDLSQRTLKTIGISKLYPDLLENPPEPLSPIQVALLRFKEDLHVSQEAKSNVIRVTFQHANPTMAAKAVNLLGKFWKEKHLKIFSAPQASFLEEQVDSYRTRLEHSENQLQEFKQEHSISSLPKQKELLLEQRQELDTKYKTALNEIRSLETKIISLAKQMKTIPREIPISTVNEQRRLVDETKRELLSLKRKEQEFSGKYHDENRLLVELRKEIDLIQTFIDGQEEKFGAVVTSGRNPVYQQLELEFLSAKSQHASFQTQRSVITKQLLGLDEQVLHLSQLQQKLDKLGREVKKDQANLTRYVEKVESAKITEKMDRQQIANVVVIQAATVPMQPARSPKVTIIVFGLIFGMLGGGATALVMEYLQRGYTRPEQVTQELGLPILASITNKQ